MITKSFYSFAAAFLVLAFSSCQMRDKKLALLPTRNIDTAVYHQLEKHFKISMRAAPDHLGGLTPGYPLATGFQVTMDAADRDTDWVDGGFIRTVRKIVVKGPDGYMLINNKADLKKMYAPVSTKEEALAYAILDIKGFALFGDFFKKKKYRFVGKPAVSNVIEKDGHYIVKLFTYVAFGCSHPYYLQTVQVDKNGDVKLISTEKSFYDPADDNICVD